MKKFFLIGCVFGCLSISNMLVSKTIDDYKKEIKAASNEKACELFNEALNDAGVTVPPSEHNKEQYLEKALSFKLRKRFCGGIEESKRKAAAAEKERLDKLSGIAKASQETMREAAEEINAANKAKVAISPDHLKELTRIEELSKATRADALREFNAEKEMVRKDLMAEMADLVKGAKERRTEAQILEAAERNKKLQAERKNRMDEVSNLVGEAKKIAQTIEDARVKEEASKAEFVSRLSVVQQCLAKEADLMKDTSIADDAIKAAAEETRKAIEASEEAKKQQQEAELSRVDAEKAAVAEKAKLEESAAAMIREAEKAANDLAVAAQRAKEEAELAQATAHLVDITELSVAKKEELAQLAIDAEQAMQSAKEAAQLASDIRKKAQESQSIWRKMWSSFTGWF